MLKESPLKGQYIIYLPWWNSLPHR